MIAKGDDIITPAARTPEEKQKQYPEGMTQPGCFVVSASGKMLYKWVLQPEQTNFFGARTRVKPQDVLSIVKDRLAGKEPAVKEAMIEEQGNVVEAIANMKKRGAAKKAGTAKL